MVGHQKIDSSTTLKLHLPLDKQEMLLRVLYPQQTLHIAKRGTLDHLFFLFDNNELSLLGITWVADFPDSSDPDTYTDVNNNGIYDPYIDISLKHTSYFSDLNSYNTEINDYIALHAIPEPATILGVLPIAIFGMFRFLRKRAEQKDSIVLK